MAASAGMIGKGTTLEYAVDTAGTPGSYTAVPELFDVKAPSTTTDKVEFTHYTSPNNRKEFKNGWSTGADGSFSCNYTAAALAALAAIEGDQMWWKITYPDSATIVWLGTLTIGEITSPNNDRMVINGAISEDAERTIDTTP